MPLEALVALLAQGVRDPAVVGAWGRQAARQPGAGFLDTWSKRKKRAVRSSISREHREHHGQVHGHRDGAGARPLQEVTDVVTALTSFCVTFIYGFEF